MSGEPFLCPMCGAGRAAHIGHEIQGVYDGVLYWSCLACGRAWSRDWTGYGRRAEVAQSYVDTHNASRDELDTT